MLTLWTVPTRGGFPNPEPSVASDGSLSTTALFWLWAGIMAFTALVIYGHHLYERGERESGAILATAPGIVAASCAVYLMRHFDSGWASFWTFVLVVVAIGGSARIHGLRLRGLGGVSLAATVLIAGIGLLFDVANRVTAAIPMSISAAVVLALFVVALARASDG